MRIAQKTRVETKPAEARVGLSLGSNDMVALLRASAVLQIQK